MKIIYYKKPDGSIRTFHRAEKIPQDRLEAALEDYNREHAQQETAFAVTYPDDSFEAYLFKRATEHIALDLRDLQDLQYDLQNAESLLYELINQAKTGEKED